MNNQERTCKNCGKKFSIEAEDFDFYKKMAVEPPELCYICGIARLMALRNERTIYKNRCDQCHRSTISMYRSGSPYVVYCHDCWWKDDWAGEDYAMDYDSSKPLFEQLKELQHKVPREALIILNSTNSDYGNNIRDSKDCYLCFQVASSSENLMYSWWMVKCKDCVSCNKILQGELLLSCIDATNCSRSAFLQDCMECSDCYFSYDLRGCNDCIFSYNLRNKSYCIENRQLTKEEYEKEKANILSGSYLDFQKASRKFQAIKEKAIRRFARTYKCVDIEGNYLDECKNCKFVFDGVNDENIKNISLVLNCKNAMYNYAAGPNPTELLYGTSVIKGGSNVKLSFNLFASNECIWCDSLISCSNCIACVGLKQKEYCILNKQYSKEEYLRIKKDLEAKGELSGYIPPVFSTFAYNETAAQDKYPLSKEEAMRQGYEWSEEKQITTGQETLSPEKLPDAIKDTPDSILNEVLKCIECNRNYKIIDRELQMYRRFNFPLPRTCPQCRIEYNRLQRLPFLLWKRQCMCSVVGHTAHPGSHCKNQFETSYAPDRPEIVYCEQCYNAEVV